MSDPHTKWTWALNLVHQEGTHVTMRTWSISEREQNAIAELLNRVPDAVSMMPASDVPESLDNMVVMESPNDSA